MTAIEEEDASAAKKETCGGSKLTYQQARAIILGSAAKSGGTITDIRWIAQKAKISNDSTAKISLDVEVVATVGNARQVDRHSVQATLKKGVEWKVCDLAV